MEKTEAADGNKRDQIAGAWVFFPALLGCIGSAFAGSPAGVLVCGVVAVCGWVVMMFHDAPDEG